jgi:hypothetical protein
MTRLNTRQADLDLLNAFLCRERSTRDAYGVLLEASSDKHIRGALTRLRNLQQERINELERRIQALGGMPRAQSSGWRTLSRITRESTGRLDNETVVFALQEYSRRILGTYRRSLTDLSPETRRFIERKILPESQLAHQSVASL